MSDEQKYDFDKTVVQQGDSDALRVARKAAKNQSACLIIIRGTPQGKRLDLVKELTTIGRDPSADLPLDDINVSRNHADVIMEGSEVRLRDNNSTNGTFVNDRPIKGTMTLRKEDMIKIGNTILKYLPAGELEIYYIGTLESAAYTDALTKVYNRGYMNEVLESEFKRAKALHEDLALIVMDLDHFKRVNDTHGHDAGDYVLKETCFLAKSDVLPKSAILGRFGGEEFLVILLQTGLEAARQTAESLRSAIEEHEFVYEGKRIAVTASFGVAAAANNIDDYTELFKYADKAVYQSKTGGRNRVSYGT
jgi:two-component system cell cycle response regulator